MAKPASRFKRPPATSRFTNQLQREIEMPGSLSR
jgi:hypothetical protein